MDEKELNILQGALGVFMRLGIKSVNMDDVAGNLGISKKTLYKYVTDKDDLVNKITRLHCEMEDRAMDAICARGLNAIDESFEMTTFIMGLLRQIHPSVLFDLQKYHPESMKEMMLNRQEKIKECISRNLEKGIQEGHYRDDLVVEIVCKIYLTVVTTLFTESSYTDKGHSLPRVYLEMFRYHIRGIASEKGLQYLIQKVAEEKERLEPQSTKPTP